MGSHYLEGKIQLLDESKFSVIPSDKFEWDQDGKKYLLLFPCVIDGSNSAASLVDKGHSFGADTGVDATMLWNFALSEKIVKIFFKAHKDKDEAHINYNTEVESKVGSKVESKAENWIISGIEFPIKR